MKLLRIVLPVFASILVLSAVALYVSYQYASSPVDPSDNAAVSVVIPRGKGAIWIGNTLKEKNLIRSTLAFRFIAWRKDLLSKMQAGSYVLNKSQSLESIAQSLTKGTNDIWVTIPEGWRNEEIAEVFGKALGEAFDQKEFLELAKDKEGYLFPETYLIPKEATPQTVVSLLTRTFEQKFSQEMQDELKKQQRTVKDAVILASLIEREARELKEMQVVSGILLKRIENSWPLQVDATLQYAKGFNEQQKTWWAPPLAADKTINSPYNTYKNPGLPPAPIANPGINSLKAAVYPTESSYWYYITDNKGEMHYAETVEQHNANVQKYLR